VVDICDADPPIDLGKFAVNVFRKIGLLDVIIEFLFYF
jgi:hypothetical protein